MSYQALDELERTRGKNAASESLAKGKETAQELFDQSAGSDDQFDQGWRAFLVKHGAVDPMP